MLWQIHHVSTAVRLWEKQLKVPRTGRAAPIVNEATSVCGPRDDTFIRKCQRRRDAQRGQLSDLQYMRLRTQGTEKMKGKADRYEKQEYRTKFARFTVIIKQLKQLRSKQEMTDTQIKVPVVRESHTGYRRSRRTSVNNPNMWAKARPQAAQKSTVTKT